MQIRSMMTMGLLAAGMGMYSGPARAIPSEGLVQHDTMAAGGASSGFTAATRNKLAEAVLLGGILGLAGLFVANRKQLFK